MRSTKFHESRVSDEIKLFAAGDVDSIAVLDPTFNTDTLWATKILDQFSEANFSGTLALQIRPEKVNPTFIAAGCRLRDRGVNVILEMGVQTFDPSVLNSIGRVKGSDTEKVVEKVKQNLENVVEHGLNAEASFIFGLPHQTIGSFERDLEWCTARLPALKVTAFPLMLLRGTPLHAQKEALGLVEAIDIEHPMLRGRVQDFIPHVVASPWFDTDDWHRMATMAASL